MNNQQTFTKKIIDVLINGAMPSEKGPEATETGLIIVMANGSTPVCASYGSSQDIIMALLSVIDQNEPIRAVIMTVAAVYAKAHPDDPCVSELKVFLNLYK